MWFIHRIRCNRHNDIDFIAGLTAMYFMVQQELWKAFACWAVQFLINVALSVVFGAMREPQK